MSQSHHTNEVDERTCGLLAKNTDKIWYGLVTVCTILILADFGYHGFMHEKHGYFVFETAVAFHALYGWDIGICCFARYELRKLIMRPENYYKSSR